MNSPNGLKVKTKIYIFYYCIAVVQSNSSHFQFIPMQPGCLFIRLKQLTKTINSPDGLQVKTKIYIFYYCIALVLVTALVFSSFLCNQVVYSQDSDN